MCGRQTTIIGDSRLQSLFLEYRCTFRSQPARHRSVLIRSAYCTELHSGFTIPEPLPFRFALTLSCESSTVPNILQSW